MTPRIANLLERFNVEKAAADGHRIVSAEESRAFAALAHASYAKTTDVPEILRKAVFLEVFASQHAPVMDAGQLLTGSKRFSLHHGGLSAEEWRAMQWHGNVAHVVPDYGRLVQKGVGGILAEVDGMPECRENKKSFRRVLEAFSLWISRHAEQAAALAEESSDSSQTKEYLQIAENCRHIVDKPPQTFWQALQLVWFGQIFMFAESGGSAISFGRFDQYMWPFLQNDLDTGVLDLADAQELLACFYLKCCDNAESQNLTVGGCDADGTDAENPLTLLCLDLAAELKLPQPSLSVRFMSSASEALWEKSLALCAKGLGQPSFFNDDVVVRGLQALQIPEPRARDWSIVGCYEATTQGDMLPLTVAAGVDLPLLCHAFVTGLDSPDFADFASFYDAFCAFLESWLLAEHKAWRQRWEQIAQQAPSPFESVLLEGCIASGLAAEEGGARYTLFGVNVLGLGTLVDSLYAIRKLVFDQQDATLADFQQQLAENWLNTRLMMRCRKLSGKFGTDSTDTNILAADLSTRIADWILAHPLDETVRPYPGFFWFGADATRSDIPATPDGRKAGERVSYGAGPGVLVDALPPTTVLHSVAGICHDKSACGNPVLVSLDRKDIAGRSGLARLRQLVETYFRLGGSHIHVNLVDAEVLRRAQQAPQAHAGLTVRISGFSATFGKLQKPWQDALIERTAKGM